jgi:hypothetical protein
MNPKKVNRNRLNCLEDLPNIGPAMAGDLRILGIEKPVDLVGQDPYVMYEQLCSRTGLRQDPCVLDVFISVIRFMNGSSAQPWWDFTAERKFKYRSHRYDK